MSFREFREKKPNKAKLKRKALKNPQTNSVVGGTNRERGGKDKKKKTEPR